MKILWTLLLSLNFFSHGDELGMRRETLLAGAEFPEKREYPVNPEVSPCSDFYEHACSKVIQSFKLREDRSYHIFSISDQAERLLFAKKNYLRQLHVTPKLSPRAQVIRDVYQACMNTKASRKEERDLVRRDVEQITRIKTREQLQKFLSERIDQPEEGFVDYFRPPNQDEPVWRDLVFVADLRTFPERSYYENPEAVEALRDLAAAFFKTVGISNAKERADHVIAVEKAMALKYPQPAEVRERMASRNPISREELLQKYPALHLSKFLERVPANVKFRNPIHESLEFVASELATGDIEKLKSVLLFKSATNYMDDAYPRFFKKRFAFLHKFLGGPKTRPARDERCTRYVMDKFERELDSELLPILFPEFPREKVVELAETIRASLIKNLKQNTWLSSAAKKAAIDKMSSANLLLVSPETDDEWYFNPPAAYSSTRRYANNRLLNQNLIAREIKELSEKRNRRRWLMGPLTVNAYYMPPDNVFVLPIGILQYPFFDAKVPMEANLAAIGSVVGHELGHGIDDKGARYDKEGRLKSWMTEDDLKTFSLRGGQFVARFDQVGHNGQLTLGENIGDHVGLTSAYSAAFPDDQGSAELKKAFFLQFARSWCNVMRPSFRELYLKTNVHAAGEARINEQVRHLNGFHETFGCKPGDAMYLPEKERIRVW